ncbi:NTP transferase domain-containing protein [Paenibacillus melissococcoides]|uniref:Glucose-1-phosphate thymidylyltransferase n=1 Tax=Paenibacillus melissococcoides TaxID=2912268 RepID=A0ABM9FVU0_9BACL|nr:MULTISPECIES: sugar phosphate nucleotidyltransferase [Paenibacillus]MEB9896420.1 sugar phosphate nucleotidyltransferase [Bacillus cereus]CAH8243280.1 NTP transferase domain-containing protein [Paenibacillus melissococcoides]CAH8704102.1 NTP transferase domain-containing protein [Paenibacillus melissococcoides]CAH8707315.1 NTP transferase domain-containing protein [Paenibacillus melissococcoides]GIO76867.1 glucose-1-phosphate thymidylyltransferase [Paenibacillus dendritiformis]
MKGIILAGGTGTRLYPLTKLMNKHLLPVGRHPMVSYGIERLRAAGITDIIMVIGKMSASLFTDYYGSGQSFGVQLTFAIQEEAGGIAQALSLAKPYIALGEKFVVLLGDNLFRDDLAPYAAAFREQRPGEARILLREVSDPKRYGVPVFDSADPKRIVRIEEKPEEPLSSYCVTGIYMYDTDVFYHIEAIVPSERGELEITDVNNRYAAAGKLQYDVLGSWWTDAGTFESLHEAAQELKEVEL